MAIRHDKTCVACAPQLDEGADDGRVARDAARERDCVCTDAPHERVCVYGARDDAWDVCVQLPQARDHDADAGRAIPTGECGDVQLPPPRRRAWPRLPHHGRPGAGGVGRDVAGPTVPGHAAVPERLPPCGARRGGGCADGCCACANEVACRCGGSIGRDAVDPADPVLGASNDTGHDARVACAQIPEVTGIYCYVTTIKSTRMSNATTANRNRQPTHETHFSSLVHSAGMCLIGLSYIWWDGWTSVPKLVSKSVADSSGSMKMNLLARMLDDIRGLGMKFRLARVTS